MRISILPRCSGLMLEAWHIQLGALSAFYLLTPCNPDHYYCLPRKFKNHRLYCDQHAADKQQIRQPIS
jgi:hypothetical protein